MFKLKHKTWTALLGASTVAAAMPASATVMLQTWTGVVGKVCPNSTCESRDVNGVFGARGAVLDGLQFRADFLFDTSFGTRTTGTTVDQVTGGPLFGQPAAQPMLGTILTINDVSLFVGAQDGGRVTLGDEIITTQTYFRMPSTILSLQAFGDFVPSLEREFGPVFITGQGDANINFNPAIGGTLHFLPSSIQSRFADGSADDPILPGPGGPAFDFNFPVFGDDFVFIDPLIATGYDYVVHKGPSITSVLLPTIAGDVDGFQILGLDGLQLGTATGGSPFQFASPVNGFRVRDIDAQLDPADPQAFMAGLKFSAPGVVSMTQTPFVVEIGTPGVPEPSTWALMILGFGTAGTMLRRRRPVLV